MIKLGKRAEIGKNKYKVKITVKGKN